ncbi:MAG TPA: hypothetical protein PLS12_10255 [Bacteroidales bacterium]|nr:hypothetical protein [Bacteroidales bacterium]
MTTIAINEKTVKGKSLLKFLEQFKGENFITIIDKQQKNTKKTKSRIEQSLDDIKNVRVTKYKSVDDYF